MKPMDVIIIVLTVAFVAYAVIKTIRNKKKGKTSCGCDCGCGSCAGCPQSCELPNKTDTAENEV